MQQRPLTRRRRFLQPTHHTHHTTAQPPSAIRPTGQAGPLSFDKRIYGHIYVFLILFLDTLYISMIVF